MQTQDTAYFKHRLWGKLYRMPAFDDFLRLCTVDMRTVVRHDTIGDLIRIGGVGIIAHDQMIFHIAIDFGITRNFGESRFFAQITWSILQKSLPMRSITACASSSPKPAFAVVNAAFKKFCGKRIIFRAARVNQRSAKSVP